MNRPAVAVLVLLVPAACRGSAPPPGLPIEGTGTAPGGAPTDPEGSSSSGTGASPRGSGSAYAPSNPRLERGVCEAMFERVGNTLEGIRRKNATCKTAHDCETTSSGICGFSVGCGNAVSLGKSAAVKKAQDEATKAECDDFAAGGCPMTMPIAIPSCPPVQAACTEGICSAMPRM